MTGAAENSEKVKIRRATDSSISLRTEGKKDKVKRKENRRRRPEQGRRINADEHGFGLATKKTIIDKIRRDYRIKADFVKLRKTLNVAKK